jgi:hypothetical protein
VRESAIWIRDLARKFRFWIKPDGNSINQIKNTYTVESITNRLDAVEERISKTKDKVKEILQSQSNKDKII